MKRVTLVCSLLFASIAASSVSAAPFYIVLLDRTGSMLELRATGNTRCEDAWLTAEADINGIFTAAPGAEVAVWTFKSFCAGGGVTDLTGGFVGQAAALAALNTLVPDDCPVSCLTNLADGICGSIEGFPAEAGAFDKFLFISSDGGENASSGPCAGPSDPDAPFDIPGTWQNNVISALAGDSPVISLRFWGALAAAASAQPAIDTEMAALGMGGVASHLSQPFLKHLTQITGGSFVFHNDADAGPILPLIGIPTVSQWGMATMVLLLLVGGKIYFNNRRARA